MAHQRMVQRRHSAFSDVTRLQAPRSSDDCDKRNPVRTVLFDGRSGPRSLRTTCCSADLINLGEIQVLKTHAGAAVEGAVVGWRVLFPKVRQHRLATVRWIASTMLHQLLHRTRNISPNGKTILHSNFEAHSAHRASLGSPLPLTVRQPQKGGPPGFSRRARNILYRARCERTRMRQQLHLNLIFSLLTSVGQLSPWSAADDGVTSFIHLGFSFTKLHLIL